MICGFPMDCEKGGGKKGGGGTQVIEAEQPKMIAPTPPVEEAGVEIDDEQDERNKKRTGKASLKIPLAKDVDTGLRI